MAEARERDDLNAITNLRTRLAYVPHLAADDVIQAQMEIIRGIREWSREGFQLQHYYLLFAYTEVLLYMGAGSIAWRMVDSNWPAVKRSLLLHSQNLRIEAVHLRARAALAASADRGGVAPVSKKLVSIAADQARRLHREGSPPATAQALIVRAGVAAARGEMAQAIEHLTAAERACERADMNLHVAAVRRRRGQIIGGGEGASLIQQADAWMTSRDIRNPANMAALLVPGVYP
jgi:hypothetical protein